MCSWVLVPLGVIRVLQLKNHIGGSSLSQLWSTFEVRETISFDGSKICLACYNLIDWIAWIVVFWCVELISTCKICDGLCFMVLHA